MNTISLIGRITKDIELRYTAGNEPKAVAKFNVAVNRDRDNADFIPVIAFGKLAENCEKYVGKGSQVGITGRLQSGSYEKEGRTIYTLDVIATSVEFIGTKAERQGTQQHTDPVPTDFKLIEEDIPF